MAESGRNVEFEADPSFELRPVLSKIFLPDSPQNPGKIPGAARRGAVRGRRGGPTAPPVMAGEDEDITAWLDSVRAGLLLPIFFAGLRPATPGPAGGIST